MGMFQRLIRTDQPESTKRAIALMASCTLCICELILILAIWYQAVVIGKVDSNLNYALGIISASVAGLAGVAYRKPEAAAGLALVAGGSALYLQHGRDRRDTAHVQAAATDTIVSNALAKEGDSHAAKAEKVPVKSDSATVARLQAEVARLRKAVADAPVPPAVPGLPEPQPVAPVVPVVQLDQTKDELIGALVQENADLKGQNAELVLADQDHRNAYVQADAAAAELRKAIHPDYHRAVGLLWAPGQQAAGIFVEQDLYRVRVGVLVVQQGLPALAGGHNQTLAMVSAGWRFR
jgi:hypothetical protein